MHKRVQQVLKIPFNLSVMWHSEFKSRSPSSLSPTTLNLTTTTITTFTPSFSSSSHLSPSPPYSPSPHFLSQHAFNGGDAQPDNSSKEDSSNTGDAGRQTGSGNEPSSPSEPYEDAIFNAADPSMDWRTFRAKLVASNQATKSVSAPTPAQEAAGLEIWQVRNAHWTRRCCENMLCILCVSILWPPICEPTAKSPGPAEIRGAGDMESKRGRERVHTEVPVCHESLDGGIETRHVCFSSTFHWRECDILVCLPLLHSILYSSPSTLPPSLPPSLPPPLALSLPPPPTHPPSLFLRTA